MPTTSAAAATVVRRASFAESRRSSDFHEVHRGSSLREISSTSMPSGSTADCGARRSSNGMIQLCGKYGNRARALHGAQRARPVARQNDLRWRRAMPQPTRRTPDGDASTRPAPVALIMRRRRRARVDRLPHPRQVLRRRGRPRNRRRRGVANRRHLRLRPPGHRLRSPLSAAPAGAGGGADQRAPRTRLASITDGSDIVRPVARARRHQRAMPPRHPTADAVARAAFVRVGIIDVPSGLLWLMNPCSHGAAVSAGDDGWAIEVNAGAYVVEARPRDESDDTCCWSGSRKETHWQRVRAGLARQGAS